MKNKISISTGILIILSLGALQISNAKDRFPIKQAYQVAPVLVKSAAELALEAQTDAKFAGEAASRAPEEAFDIFFVADKATAAQLAADAARKAANYASETAGLVEKYEKMILKAAHTPESRKLLSSAAEEADYQERYEWASNARRLLKKTKEYAAVAKFFRTAAERAASE